MSKFADATPRSGVRATAPDHIAGSPQGQAVRRHVDAMRFPRRVYRLRMLGCSLSALYLGAVLFENQASSALWMLLFLSAFIWPQVALQVSKRSADPSRTECRNLVVDSMIGGAWIALIEFNLLPSALLATMLTIDKVNSGIARLWLWSSLALVNACIAVALLNGLAFRPQTSMTVILASLPMLIAYPLALSAVSHRLLRRVRRQNRALDELSRTDMLTGLSGRRDWQERAEDELHRQHRTGHPACLLMIDIDQFKAINDRHGHTVGDEVIRAVAGVIRDSLREVDCSGRFGGDEFGIVLEGTRYRQATTVAERIRQGVERITLQSTPGVQCSVSIGIAEAVNGHADLLDWLGAADGALYRAKAAGRNRIAGPIVMPIASRHPPVAG